MTADYWEHFTHDADIGLRGVGATLGGAFVMLGQALTAVVTDPKLVEAREELVLECQAPDLEFLAYEWLNALIYEMDRRKMLFSSFHIDAISETELRATVRGEPVARDKHQPAVDVKGATMTELKVFQRNGEWVAQCVVDV